MANQIVDLDAFDKACYAEYKHGERKNCDYPYWFLATVISLQTGAINEAEYIAKWKTK